MITDEDIAKLRVSISPDFYRSYPLEMVMISVMHNDGTTFEAYRLDEYLKRIANEIIY